MGRVQIITGCLFVLMLCSSVVLLQSCGSARTTTNYVSPADNFIRPGEVPDVQEKAESGDIEAAKELAGYYLFGYGQDEPNAEAKARHWNLKAAQYGDKDTQKHLVVEYTYHYLTNPSGAKLALGNAAALNWPGAKEALDKIAKEERAKSALNHK